MKRLPLTLLLALVSSVALGEELAIYTTTFDLTEDPISEGGVWSRIDSASTAFRSGSGRAWGKQSGANGYDDSQATLYGITNPNVRAEAIIYRDAAIGGENHEIEICLRTVEGSTWTKKYEFLWNAAGNVSIGKWLGNDGAGGGHTFTDFPGLAPIEGYHQYGTPSTGTRIIAQAFNIGPSTVRLRAWVQHPGDASPRLVQESIDDGTSGSIEGGGSNTPAYMAGSPGIGGYINNPSSNLAHFAFQSFEVRVISNEDEPL